MFANNEGLCCWVCVQVSSPSQWALLGHSAAEVIPRTLRVRCDWFPQKRGAEQSLGVHGSLTRNFALPWKPPVKVTFGAINFYSGSDLCGDIGTQFWKLGFLGLLFKWVISRLKNNESHWSVLHRSFFEGESWLNYQNERPVVGAWCLICLLWFLKSWLAGKPGGRKK